MPVASVDESILAPARPALATTYEGDSPALLDRIAHLVDYIEITPDTIAKAEREGARLRPEVLDEYRSVSPGVKFIAHGVGLSIGSYDRWNEEYFRLLDPLFETFDLEWHSEHLAFARELGSASRAVGNGAGDRDDDVSGGGDVVLGAVGVGDPHHVAGTL